MSVLIPALQSNHTRLRSIADSPEKCARAVRLFYVSDAEPGIQRVRHGKTFRYTFKGKPVKDPATLHRIRALVLPPAWKNVWICARANGHLQATGLDARNRKQYRYHTSWSAVRSLTKFYRLSEFGNTVCEMRARLKKDLSLSGLPQNKVLAIVVSLMDCTGARPGSSAYEKLYGSFGLTTLKDSHVKVEGSDITFCFKGKKGVTQKIGLRNQRLARLVRQCKEIPGKELFQYYDKDGMRRCIDSGMVNQYLREISGKEFTAKDFRTWAGTVRALCAFRQCGRAETITAARKNIVTVLDDVARHLGNTRTVCKKYYVHPLVIQLYEQGKLHSILETHKDPKHDLLQPEEVVLLKILDQAPAQAA
jgi:DNA topoisomerase I